LKNGRAEKSGDISVLMSANIDGEVRMFAGRKYIIGRGVRGLASIARGLTLTLKNESAFFSKENALFADAMRGESAIMCTT
jgi:hypothetical protein